MKRKILDFLIKSSLLFCFLQMPAFINAQYSDIISGNVQSENGYPLPGTTITVKNRVQSTVTDNSGHFSIAAMIDEILIVSNIGFETLEVKIANRTNLDIVLVTKATELSDVVVTALGIKRQARALTYATQEIKGSDLSNVKDPGGNVMNSLNGKVANLVITPAGSGPGGAVKVVMRGNRSINGNNNALIVVDGIPLDNTMSTEVAGGGSANTFGTQVKSISSSYSGMDGASSINTEDIESVTVLKGPAAAALYGSRAANGALIITTKSGKIGKPVLNYNTGFSIDNPYLLNKFQNTYGRGNGAQHIARAAQSWGTEAITYPDNVRSFYQTGMVFNNSVDVSGGTEKLKGYASYTNSMIKGIVPKNDLVRNNANLRIAAEILPKLTMDAKITYLNQEIEHLPRLGDQGVNNEVYIMPRDLSGDSLKIFERIDPVTGQPLPIYWTNSSIFQNPNWDVHRMIVNQLRDRVTLLGSLKYQFTDWLSLQARYSWDKYNDKISGSYYAGTTLFPFDAKGGRYQESVISHQERNIDLLLSGRNELSNSLALSYNLGTSILNIEGSNTSSLANGLIVPNKFNFNFASNLSVTNIPIKKEIQSVYGNVQFDYKGILYLDGSLRTDWASTLPAPYRYSYPSLGLSAILSGMMAMPDWISFAKIRGAFTNVGNDADPYQLLQLYTYSQGAGNGFVSRSNTKSISDLKPEKTRSLEVGLDWKFFNNRLGIDATFYKNNTINQLVSIGLPLASGFQFQYINVGDIENKGFEAMITAIPVLGNNFRWNTNFNFGLNRNKVISLKEGISQTTISPSTNFGQLIIKPGGSYGDIYGYSWQQDPSTGKYLINAAGLPVATNAQDKKIGNFNPDYMLGWGNRFSYKNVSLTLQLDGRVGGIIMSGTDALMTSYGVSEITTNHREGGLVLNGIKADGTPNTTAINAEKLWTTLSNGGRSSGYDEFFAFSATNFRVREVALGYDFDIQNGIFRQIRAALTGRNLFFLYRGESVLDIPGIPKRKLPVDPEAALGTSNFQGIESGLPPITRSIGLNLYFNFK